MKCINCEFESPFNLKFCGNCVLPSNQNTSFSAFTKIAILQPQQVLKIDNEVERRHLTVKFCDLVGSTTLSARLDPVFKLSKYAQTHNSIIK